LSVYRETINLHRNGSIPPIRLCPVLIKRAKYSRFYICHVNNCDSHRFHRPTINNYALLSFATITRQPDAGVCSKMALRGRRESVSFKPHGVTRVSTPTPHYSCSDPRSVSHLCNISHFGNFKISRKEERILVARAKDNV